ncbi:hypothetical protein Rhopal_002649-T1 [Rhodotorula paludigena]|uniref:DNA repair metallo-beta-lactamase domain-containing protein n=1 Tax=Rhodotorula paludigena TaxID=86838 RepID=A0AAV5GKU0_9BASI|nr:hypothetical protein Rhopal_002649-T1 [Rhodotorula paludigena]
MAPAPTLDSYLRSSTPAATASATPPRRQKRTSPPTPAPAASAKKPKQPLKCKGKGKATAPGAPATKGKKKARPRFVADNRNLGTLDLVDSSDDERDAVQVVAPGEPEAGPSSAVKGKGRARVMLVEEDWLAQDEADSPRIELTRACEGGVGAGEPVKEAERPQLVDDGPEGTANLLAAQSKLRDPAEQDPLDGCTDDEGGGVDGEGGRDGGEPETLALSDDEVLVLDEGPTCPRCKILLETLPIKKRDSHVASCLAPPDAAAPPDPPAPSRSLLAPLSRLFTRAPAAAASSASSSSAADPAKKPLSVLSSLPNAFTALMAGHAETKQWKMAEEADKQKGRRPKGEERKVPFYKWIDGLEITVDAFKYGKIDGCKAYFLSHAHSDHYQNLSSSWAHGPIYASQTTINLIKLKLGVKDEWLHALPLDKTVKVHGIDVTLIDANHCPGSVLFLFESPHTDPKSPYSKTPNRIFRYLHCGDFRASPQHILHPCMSMPTPPSRFGASTAVTAATSMSRSSSSSSQPAPSSSGFHPLAFSPLPPHLTLKKLDAIYLDTTYLSPSYCFPAQELVIAACADLVRERVVEGDEAALWRADGRDAERKGMKGWLQQQQGDGTKSEGVKEEDERAQLAGAGDGDGFGRDEGDDEPHELEPLPEERDDNEDEEAWLAMHGEGERDSRAPHEHEADDEDDAGESQMWRGEEEEREGESEPMQVDGAHACEADVAPAASAVDGAAQADQAGGGPPEQEEFAQEVKQEGDMQALKIEEIAADLDPSTSALVDGAKPDVEPDVKPDIKPDIKPDVKPAKERLLVLVGTYSIGKERIVKAIAHALSTKIFCDQHKRNLFLAQDDPELHALLTEDPLAAQVHVGGLRDITREAMSDYLAMWKAPRVEGGFTKMIGLRPTGWTYRSETKDKMPSIAKILQIEQQRKFSPAGLYPQRDSTPMCMAFGVPYSEHSSFFELTCFCLSLDYVRIIPTVNVHTAASRNKMKGWIDRWAAEKKRRADTKAPKVVPFRHENYW